MRDSAQRVQPLQEMLFDASEYKKNSADDQEFLAGSPRVALNIDHPFSTYVFVERSLARISALEKLKAEYGDSRRIVIRKDDCTQYLKTKVAENPRIDWKKNRAVVFLDPYGMQVNWNTLEFLASTKAIEVFLNFPVGMAIQRLLLRQPDNFRLANRRRLDEFFGSDRWFDLLYKRRSNLLNLESVDKIEESGQQLVRWYRDRLAKLFGFASRACLIRNSHGAHLYYLMLASPNKTGARIASDVLSGEFV